MSRAGKDDDEERVEVPIQARIAGTNRSTDRTRFGGPIGEVEETAAVVSEEGGRVV